MSRLIFLLSKFAQIFLNIAQQIAQIDFFTEQICSDIAQQKKNTEQFAPVIFFCNNKNMNTPQEKVENNKNMDVPPKKVTASPSQKVKNPKKVEAGKKLAAKNKERLAKIKEWEESKKSDNKSEESNESAKEKTTSTNELLIGASIIGVLALALGLGYWFNSNTPPAAPPSSSPQTTKCKPQPRDEFEF